MPRKRTVILAVTTALVLALPITADRVTQAALEHQVAARLQCALGLTAPPDVQLGGFPFLPHLATGTMSGVRVTADDVQAGPVTLTHLAATATGLSLATPLTATTITLDTTIAYQTLTTLARTALQKPTTPPPPTTLTAPSAPAAPAAPSSTPNPRLTDKSGMSDDLVSMLAGATIGGDGDGRLVIGAEIPLQGRTLPVRIYADLAMTDGAVTIRPAEVEVSAFGLRVPAERLGALGEPRTVPLPDLPAGLTIASIEARPDGVRLVATGHEVAADLADRGVSGTLPRCRP